MAYATQVTIAGTDVTNYVIEYSGVDTVEDITPCEVTLRKEVLSLISLTTEQELIIQRGGTTATDTTVFRGYISSIKKAYGVNIKIEAFDKLWNLQRVTLSKTYDINIDPQAGVISAIAQDLIETYGGLTADVEATGSINVLQKFILRGDSLLDKLQELAAIVDYWVYYDPETDTVLFKSKGFTTFRTTLQVGTNLTAIPKWDYDYSRIANNVTLKGNNQEFEDTFTDTGDGIETVYTLTYKPESVKVFVNSVLKTGGISGQSSTFDYSVDKENRTITFQVAPPNTQAIEIQYSYLQPIKVTQRNPVSISQYGNYGLTKAIDSIQTVADAEEKIQEILDKFSQPIVSCDNLKLYNVFGLQAGNKVTIVDAVNGENRDVFVRRFRFSYPEIVDEIEVDNEPLFEDYVLKNAIRKRIERIERRNESDTDLVITRFVHTREIKPRRRYFKLLKDVLTLADSFILAHPSGGVLGTNKLGGTYASQDVAQKIIQGNMTYEEYCYDTDFHDSVNSTATFSTVTQDIAFTSGQIWYSTAIDIGTTLSQVRVDLGTTSGTLLIEISSDNKTTWQTVAEGILTSVTTSDGTGTFIRITENAASTASIDLTQDSFGQNTEPVIKVLMVE